MSIEYTIDIQLTELGYPEIIQQRDTSVRGQQAEAGAAKHAAGTEGPTAVSTPPLSPPCPVPQPAHRPQGEPAVKGSAARQAAGRDGRGKRNGDSAEMLLDDEDDSEDSDDSDVYEEEEVDEDEDDVDVVEEGSNNESSHSGLYRCSVCSLQLSSKFKLQDHMNLHTGARPYCCAECGKRFCQIYNYRVHLRTHAQTNVERHMCRVCMKHFRTQESLSVHLSRTHFENEFYECDLCKRVFTSLKECESHVQLHKCRVTIPCEVCGRYFSSLKSLEHHKKKKCHRSFQCTDCSTIFTKKNALLKHSFSHLGLLPYTCVRCRCHFRLARLYRQHKCEPERIHCVACLREFLSQEDFQQHKKDTGCWGNQEPKGDEIRCLECGQRFDTSEELKKHAGAHQRVLKCAECGKGFRSALLLMSHMGGHAGKSPCLCKTCGLGFPHQQNYDSHLKTCGKTPQPASAPKKRPASKSSSSEIKKVNPKPDFSTPRNIANMPAAAVSTKPAAAVSMKPAAAAVSSETAAAISREPAAAVSSNCAAAVPVADSPLPGPVTGGVSTGSGPSDGLWKLTLDKQPPPGVKLVVFLPVSTTQSNGLTLPSANSPTPPVPAAQVPPQVALPPFSTEEQGGNVSLGAPQNGPLNLATGIRRDPECEAPLDLSKKYSTLSALINAPLSGIKSEPGEFEISGEANGTERPEFNNSDCKANVKTNPDPFTEVMMFKKDPMDLSSCNVDTTSSGLIIDVKKEPQSPDPESDSQSSRSCQLTETEIKMEVDGSHPASVEK